MTFLVTYFVSKGQVTERKERISSNFSWIFVGTLSAKIQQTKMLVMCQRFGVLFLFGLVLQYSSVQTKYNKGSHGYLLAAVI